MKRNTNGEAEYRTNAMRKRLTTPTPTQGVPGLTSSVGSQSEVLRNPEQAAKYYDITFDRVSLKYDF